MLGSETRYLPLEKLVLVLLTASRKLPHYFQSHQAVVFIEYPLKALLRKAYFSGRILTWSVELSQYEIDYQPQTAIKGQVLGDFIAEFSPTVAPPPPQGPFPNELVPEAMKLPTEKAKAPARQDLDEWK